MSEQTTKKINCYAYNKIFHCYKFHKDFSSEIDGNLILDDDGCIYLVRNGKEPWKIKWDILDPFMEAWCYKCEYTNGCPIKITERWNNYGKLRQTPIEEDEDDFLDWLNKL